MANIKNVIKKAKAMTGKINSRYDMGYDNIVEIYEGSQGWFDMISVSFKFGYLQGMKAAKAEMRKGGVA